MTLVFFDGPRTVLMVHHVTGAARRGAADRFSSLAEMNDLIHEAPVMYRRSY